MAKHKQTMQQTLEDNRFSEYYKCGLWRCSASPTGAHHWLIDGGRGQCMYCGQRRQFAESVLVGYSDPSDSLWSQDMVLPELLKELLPIA